jgi:hypothetical protein
MSNNSSGGGISFAGILQIVFITLKLIGKIDWSWSWVLSPTWISAIFIFVILIFLSILSIVDKKNRKKGFFR